jgi:hypothetical protein
VSGNGSIFISYNRLWTLNGDNQFEQAANIDYAFSHPFTDGYEFVMGDVTGDQKDDVVYFYGHGAIEIYYYSSGQYRRSFQKLVADSTSHKEAGCLPNVDDDSFILRDRGQRELLFTDPQVIAVLASPPYFDGINEDGDGGTSFGYSKSSGSSNSFGFSVGTSVGYEWSAPFGLASAEFEVSVTSSFSWAQSSSVEISESWGWNNPIAQDLAGFTAIPFDVYYYEVLKSPSGENAKPGDLMAVNDLKQGYADLKGIYTATDEVAAREGLEALGKTWESKYPMLYRSWDDRWNDLGEYVKYSPEIGCALYTTNTIESFNYPLRKVMSETSFPQPLDLFDRRGSIQDTVFGDTECVREGDNADQKLGAGS